jgi:hypothetical protein
MLRPKSRVVERIGGQALHRERQLGVAGGGLRGGGHELHETLRADMAGGLVVEGAFLAYDRIDQRAIDRLRQRHALGNSEEGCRQRGDLHAALLGHCGRHHAGARLPNAAREAGQQRHLARRVDALRQSAEEGRRPVAMAG